MQDSVSWGSRERASCAPNWSPLKPGSVPQDWMPRAAVMHTSPGACSGPWKHRHFLLPQSALLLSPLCVQVVWRPGLQKSLSLLLLTHASSQRPNKRRGHVSRFASEAALWRTAQRNGLICSPGGIQVWCLRSREEGWGRNEIRIPCGEAHTQAYIPLRGIFILFHRCSTVSRTAVSSLLWGKRIATVVVPRAAAARPACDFSCLLAEEELL